MVKLSLKFLKIIKTCNLYLSFFVVGLCISVPGPTLIDLTYLVHTSIKNIIYIYGGRSLGAVLGSVIGGILFDMTEKKQMFLTIFNFITSICMIGIPFSRQINVLSIWMVINGVSFGAVITCGNVYCLCLWGKNNGPFYQALHLAFGFGGFIAPLIASPFLENFPADMNIIDHSTSFNHKIINKIQIDHEVQNTSYIFNSSIPPFLKSFPADMNATDNSTVFNNQMINGTQVDHQVQNISSISSSSIPTVTYPYVIIGAFGLFVTILFLITCIVSPKDEDAPKGTVETSIEKSKFFTCTLLLLTTLIVLMSMGTEIAYGQMLATYAVKGSLQLLSSTGSYMTAGYWISFTISRLITIYLMMKLSNMQLFSLNIIIICAGSLVLVLLARYYIWALWLATVLIGSGISFFYPAVVSWLDRYITVTSKKASIFSVTNCVGEMLLPYIISPHIEDKPEVFSYVNVISCMSILILVTIMYFMLRNTPDKYSLQNQKKEEKTKDNFAVIHI